MSIGGPVGRAKSEIDQPLRRVRILEGFWSKLINRNIDATLPHVIGRCESEGHLRNLEIAAGRMKAEYHGGPDRDSNLFKTIEGAAYCLMLRADPRLDVYLDSVIEKLAAAQEPNGYLQSYFSATRPNQKYQDLHRSHELYCAGHLFEAAVAHFEATGKRSLLNIAIKCADHLDATFGPGKLEKPPGHQEVELALVKLYRVTGETRYLELSRYFVDMRGDGAMVEREYSGKPVIESDRHPGRNRPPAYRQDHLPALEQREPTGHAVRAGYYYAGMADIAMEYASKPHATAVNALWDNIVAKHLYITGGVGTHQNRDEGFGDPYRLPNDTGYCETCGGIALLLFSHRMNLLNADAKHADLIETILLNHLLGSTAQDGRAFFYRNALASAGDRKRNPWSDPACCATNVVRIFPQIGRFIYATSAEALYVDQFISSETELNVGGLGVGVRMQTDYPWDGRVSIELSPETRREFEVCIRIPAWVRGKPSGGVLYTAIGTESGTASVRVNGQTIGAPLMRNGYCAIRRMWNAGDTIVVDMPMPVQRVVADERVEENHDRTAIMRGPIVYCIEGVDHAVETGRLALHDDAELSDSPNTNLLGGVWTVSERGGALNAIPYYAWNNRGAGPMMVWVPRRR